MKKIIITTGLGIAMCLSSMGQGFFSFADSSATAVYDNFTAPGTTVKSPANVMVGILWSTSLSATIPSFGTSGSGTNQVGSWAGIASDPNFHLALAGGNPLTALTRTGIPLGTFSGGVVGIDGTQPSDTIAMYVVAWKASDGAAGFGTSSVLGWSNKFNELLGSAGVPGAALSGGMSGPLIVNNVPEPATFAIAGLGVAAMLIARRRK